MVRNQSVRMELRVTIKLIVDGKELTNISGKAKKWFLDVVLNGVEGPFTYKRINGETDFIILNVKDSPQMDLF